jgi:hypothetical protein
VRESTVCVRNDGVVLVAGILLWAVSLLLTAGPISSAQRRGDGGWTWIEAAMLWGPLAGVGYYLGRHAQQAAARRSGHAHS